MKIQSSDVRLSGQHQSVQQHTKFESLKAWVGNQRPDFEGRERNAVRDNVALSEQAKAAAQADTGKATGSKAVDPEKDFENDPRAMLIRLMVEAFTGRKIHFTAMENIDTGSDAQPVADPNQAANPAPSQAQTQQTPPLPPSTGFNMEYNFHESYHEAESTNFSAQGVVKTADGKEINFDLQLSMERSYSREVNISVRQVEETAPVRQKKDPLVINFGGTAAQLTSTKFSFDIDANGSNEQLSFVTPNSGFIALDKNNDGKINNGSELFGAKSGDGFKELAAYDQDKNGWIDENDAVFEQLKVWRKDAQGKDSLVGLKQSGVGALYLGAAATPFEIKTGSNDSLGAVRSSGIYLNENGSAGTLQQIDLTV
jgi:hypothetical protein